MFNPLYIIACLCFSISIAPSYFGAVGGSVWRLTQIILIVALFLDAKRISFNVRFASQFLPFVIGVTVSALAVGSVGAIVIVVRHCVLYGTAAFLATPRFGRKNGPGTQFFSLMLALSVLTTFVFLLVTFRHGWSWEDSRVLKGDLVEGGGLPANITLFVYAISLVMAFPKNRGYAIASIAIFFAASLMLATRTPALALLTASAVVFAGRWAGVLGYLRRSRLSVRFLISSALILFIVCSIYWFAQTASPEVARESAGRVQLWQTGFLQWEQSKIFGDANQSLQEALDNAFPLLEFAEKWEFNALIELLSGGFHNTWIQTLASFGLVGFLGLLVTVSTILTRAFGPEGSTQSQLLCSMLMVRFCFEWSSPFALGSAPLDFITLIALAAAYNAPITTTQRSPQRIATVKRGQFKHTPRWERPPGWQRPMKHLRDQ